MATKPRKGRGADPAPDDRTAAIAVAAAALVCFLALAWGNIVATSPTNDEVVHLAAGYTYVTLGDYRMNLEHPPLLKQLAALPLLAADVWPRKLQEPGEGSRSMAALLSEWQRGAREWSAEWTFAHRLFYSLRDQALDRVAGTPADVPTTARFSRADFLNDSEGLFTRARLMMLSVGVTLAVLIFAWSRELWGWIGAALSTLLFCFDPNFIAHTPLVTTDAGVSLFMFGAVYFFWRTTVRWSWPNAIACASMFALAQVAKFSAVLLLPAFLILAIYRVASPGDGRGKRAAAMAGLIAACGLASIGVIWAGYGFRYEPARDGVAMPELRPTIERWYAAKSLIGQYPVDGVPEAEVTRAARHVRIGLVGRTLLALDEWRILPKGYTRGIAGIAESTLYRHGFLAGRYSRKGFPEYFAVTILLKTPIPTLILILVGLFAAARRGGVLILLVPVAVYVAHSMISGMNIGHRHLLPIYPFLYVIAGVSGATPRSRIVKTAAIAVIALSSLAVVRAPSWMWGNHIAYMNEFAGGPKLGDRLLADSNIDWGQDLERLSRWLDERKITEPINLVYFGQADPKFYGIRHHNMRLGYVHGKPVPVEAAAVPGYFAISTNHFLGIGYPRSLRYFWPEYLTRHDARRVGTAGDSIQIWRVEK